MPKKTLYDVDGMPVECIEYNGGIYPIWNTDDLDVILPQLCDFQGRDDDIVILTYPKAGTHWIWEICSMLLNGKAEILKESKKSMMLESTSPSELSKLPSVRLLNTHIKPSLYPRDLIKRQCKIISVVRNPKDIAVSKYHHMKKIDGYKGTFRASLELFLSQNDSFGPWFTYMKQWHEFFEENKAIPVLHLCYEEMKMDLKSSVDKVDQFLNTGTSEELKEQVTSMCQFDSLKNKPMNKMLQDIIQDNNHPMFRKGIIGDWKTHFTVAQNERFNQRYKDEMKGFSFNFDKYM